MRRNFLKNGKKAVLWWDHLGSWLIAIALAVLVIAGLYLSLKKTDTGAIAFIKNIFRFGRGSYG